MRQQLAELEAQEAERKQAETAQQEPEEDYRRLFELLPIGITILDMKGVIKYCNPAVYNIGGYSEGDYSGKHFSKIASVRVKDVPKYIRVFNSIVRGKTPEPFEAIYPRKDGTTGWTELNVGLIKVGGKRHILVMQHDITERKRAEEALRESEERFSKAFRSSPDVVTIVTLKDGIFLEVNDSFTRVTGYNREEVIGRSSVELGIWVKPEERDRILQILKEQGSIRNEEFEFRMKSGEIRIGLFSADIINFADETCMIDVVTDITERKKMEDALRESEEKFSKAFRSSPDTIVITTLKDGKYIEINDSYSRITGYSREELIGHSSTEIDIWAKAEDRARLFKILKEQGRVNNEEFEFRMKNGEIRTWMFSAEPINIGGEQCLIGVSTDITERKQAEEELRESEDKFSIAFRSSPEMIIITDVENNKYLEVNDSYANVIGYSREEIMSHSVDYFQKIWVNPEELEKTTSLLQTEGKMRNEEFSFRTKSGEIRQWLCSADIVNIGGKVCMLAIASDITERKQMEEALRESEEKFSKAFRSSPEIIAITTFKDGKFLEANDSFTRITGYTREEVIGHSSTEINIWAEADDRSKMLQILKKQGRVYSEEFKFRMKSGEIRTWLFSAEKINIGGEECLITITTDITELKKREQLQHDENNVLTLLGQEAELSELLDAIVHLGEYHDPSIKGSVLLFDSSRDWLVLASAPSLPDDYKELLKNGLPIGPNMGSCGTAAYLKERVIIPDIKNSPLFPYEEVTNQIIGNGLLAGWSQPIISSNGDLLGTIANYSSKIGEPDEDNLKVLEWSARIAAIAIERKQVEEQLRLLSSVTQQVSDSTIVFSPDNKITYMNKAAQDLLGYSLEEVLGENLDFFNVKPIGKSLAQEILQTASSGKRWVGVMGKRRKDSSTFIGECNISALYDQQGQITSYIDVMHDVTESLRIEEALRESEDKFSKAFHSSPDIISIVNLEDNKFAEVNDSFIRYTGYTHEEVIGHTANELGIWAKTKERDKVLRMLKERGRVSNEEIHTRMKSGEIRLGLFSAETIHIGGKFCSITVITDITERKQMEEALRESEERYRDLFDNASDLIQSVTPDGHFIYVNKAWWNLLGYSEKEVKNLTVWDIIHPDYITHCKEIFQKIMSGERVEAIEAAFITKHGREIQVEGTANAKHDGDKVVATQGMFRDVTQRKRAEAELKQALSSLEQSSAQLTATNKELEAFSYSVSHDLRSPLRSIDGFSQALLEDYTDKLDENGQDYLKRLRGASQKMGELIDGLLKLSSLTRSEMHKDKVDLSALAKEIATRLQETQPEHHAKFDISKGLTTSGDRQLLRVLMENLLGNAWKFTSKSPKARIEFGATQNGDKKAYFVRDNGVGFDMTYADKLFGAFQRLHKTTEFPGTGIGLATVQRIINRHGGTVWAEGAVGKGATFYFTLN